MHTPKTISSLVYFLFSAFSDTGSFFSSTVSSALRFPFVIKRMDLLAHFLLYTATFSTNQEEVYSGFCLGCSSLC